tara:strand:+ start:1593 stop:1766 length:174 start_codon:yes stop_codon:yes gene_type:complete
MARVKDWIMGMEEDATWMSRDVFIRAHGIHQVDIYDKVNSDEEDAYEPEPDLEYYGA